MARATRSKPAPKEPTPEPTPSTIKPLPASTSNPPKLFILPKDTSSDARIVTLDNPATSTPSRYYFCPSKGFHEFTRIAAPKKACRSWLLTSQDDTPTTDDGSAAQETEGEAGLGSGYVTKDATLFLATRIDLLFLILPALAPESAKDTKQHFLALDDYTDALSTTSPHWRTLLTQHPTLRTTLEKKMRTVCDTVDAGSEIMYRISHTKLLAVLVKKAERMVRNGLPPSMEEKFVKSALEVPVMSIRREDSSLSAVSASTPTADAETQPTNPATPSPASAEPQTQTPTPPEIPHLLRLRTTLSYLTSSYLPPTLHAPITTLISTSTTPNFAPLTTHLSAIGALKAEAAALRSISDNVSRKRQFACDEEQLAEREEKRRKKEDEELRKKREGRGVRALKKVDTSGMKKMSAFFTVRPK